MSLSFKQFQDLLCKNGCGFMARPTLQGYCPKCWSDKCLPSSSESDDSNHPKEPNLSAMTPDKQRSLSVDAQTNKEQKRSSKGGKASQQSDGRDKATTLSTAEKGIPSDRIKNSTAEKLKESSQPKASKGNTAHDSIESILSMTGVNVPVTSRPLTFWDVDGGGDGDTSKSTADVNSSATGPAEPQQAGIANTITAALQPAYVGARERSPSPDLEVLEDVKKPEPELITIEDTDDAPVASEPLNRMIVNKVTRPQPPRSTVPATRYATPPNQLQLMSPTQGGLAYILPPLHPNQAPPIISSVSQLQPVQMNRNTILTPAGTSNLTQLRPLQMNRNTIPTPFGNSTVVNGPPVRMAVGPNSSAASNAKKVTTTYYVISNQSVLGNSAQPPRTLNPQQLSALTKTTSAPVVSTAARRPTSVSGASAGAQKPSRPIILSKSPVKVTSQAAQGTHVMLETHPVSKGTVTPSNVQTSRMTTVYVSPPTTATAARAPPVAVTNSSYSTQNNSNLWADWRKKLANDKPSLASAMPTTPPSFAHSYARVPVPKPPQPTRLMQIMSSGQSVPKPNRPQTEVIYTSRQTAGTPFSALLQHFHDQRQPSAVPTFVTTPQSVNARSNALPGRVIHQQGISTPGGGSRQIQSTATSIPKRINFQQPVRRLNKRPNHKCRYCRKHFQGDVRYFRNHMWMHRQKYRPYWYEKEDADDTNGKPRLQIGRRPFMLLYTPGSPKKKKRRTNWKQILRKYLLCRFCRQAFDDVKNFIMHEQSHMKIERRAVGQCGVCSLDLSWKYSMKQHMATIGHSEKLKTLYSKIRSYKKEPSSFWSWWLKTLNDTSSSVDRVPQPRVMRVIPYPPSSTRVIDYSSSTHGINDQSSTKYSGKDVIACSRCGTSMMRKSLPKHDRNSACGKKHLESLEKQKQQQQRTEQQPQGQLFNCSTCAAIFDEEYHLTLHQLAHTRDKLYSFSCTTCGANFARRELLATHKRIHDIDTPFPCEHCNYRFRKSEDLTDHMRELHPDVKPCVCKECSACFKDKISLEYHMELLHKPRQQSSSTEDETVGSFGCLYCSETFRDREKLTAHQKIHNPNLTGEEEPVVINKVLAAAKPCHICLKCGKEFRNKASLRGHMESHCNSSTSTNLPCTKCKKKFKTTQALSYHMVIIHGDKQAARNAKNKNVVQVNKTSTTKTGPSSTTKTGPSLADSNELFSRSGVLKRILGGDGISPIAGDSESEGLSVKVSAAGESNVFDPNKNVIISQSGSKTQNVIEKGNRNKENQAEESVVDLTSNQDAAGKSERNRVRKISKCKYCVRMFLKKSKLISHQKMHAIYRPYQCQHCFSRFKEKTLWVKHMKAHLPYPCGACDKTWVTYNGFVNHAVAVHGELKEALLAAGSPPIAGSKDRPSLRGHRCAFCNRRFCREGMRLKIHLRNHLLYYKRYRKNKVSHPTSDSGAIGDVLKKTVKENVETDKPGEKGASSDQQYWCGFCGEAFFSRSEATEHMATKCPKRRKPQGDKKSGEKGGEIKKSPQESIDDRGGESQQKSKDGEIKKSPEKSVDATTNKADCSPGQFVCWCGSRYSHKKSLKAHRKKRRHPERGNSEPNKENTKNSPESSASVPAIEEATKVGNQTKEDDKAKLGAPYTCPDCNQNFALWRLREEHIRRVHKNFNCQYCQKTFLVYQILMKHEKKHKARGDVMKDGSATESAVKKSDNDVQKVEEKAGKDVDEKKSENVEELQDEAISSSTKASKSSSVKLKEESKSSDDSSASSDSDWDGGQDDDSSESDSQLERRRQIQQKIKTENMSEDGSDVEKEVNQFQCETCDRTFRRKLNLIQHSRIHKADPVEKDQPEEEAVKNIECEECDRTFSRRCDLAQHMKAHTLKKYPCKLCPRSFDKYLLLLRHNRSLHPGNKVRPSNKDVASGSSKVNKGGQNHKLTCKVCFEEFTDTDKMAEHNNLHSGEKKFVCHVCNMTFLQSWDLIVHKREHTREELRHTSGSQPIELDASSSEGEIVQRQECTFCGYVCKDSSHLEQHEKTHSSSKKFTCNFCGKAFDRNDELRSHYNKVHYAQRSEEEEDDEGKGKDEKHLQGHEEESDWDDNFDGQEEVSESDSEVLPGGRYPRRQSTKRKRYITSDDEYEENLDSNRYPKRRREKKSYKDPTEQDLDLSASDHDEEKITSVKNQTDEPFKCTYCGIGFTLQEDWSFHEYQHLQTEPFRCQFCFKLFSRRSNLIQHEKSHQGNRPYSCLECGASFAKDSSLKLHKEQQHSKALTQRQIEKKSAPKPLTALNEPYPHNCGLCGKGFYKPSGLAKHQERCRDSEDDVSTNKLEDTPFVKERNAAKLARLQMANNQTSSDEDFSGGNDPIEESESDDEDEPYQPLEGEVEDESFQCRFCHKDFALKKQVVKHEMGVHKAKGPLECIYCDKAFWNAKARDLHQGCHKRKGDDVKIGKEPSNVKGGNEEQVQNIMKIKEEEKDIVYKCRFCKNKFPLRKMVVKHEIKVHDAKGPLPCGYCDQTFWFPYEKKRHEEVKHRYEKDKGTRNSEAGKDEATSLKCKVCSKTFPTRDQLISHEKTHLHKQSFKCKFCLKSFPSQSDQEKHEKTHNVPKESASTGSFGCLFCHEMFTLKSALIDHIQTHSGRESYMCPHCDLTFPTSATLQAHEKEHLQPTIYQCSHCQALFRDKEKLIKHEASHEDSGYRCLHCNVTFISSQGLSNHLLSQHGETEKDKTPSPSVVNKAKKILQPVVKLHSISPKSKSSSHASPSYSQEEEVLSESEQEIDNDRDVVDAIVNPYSCNVCKQSFPSPEDLKLHVRSHAKDHGRKCHYCGKGFNTMSNLRKHLRLHLRSTGESGGEFKCQKCGIKFQKKAALISHLKSHAKTKAKPYSFHKRNTGFGLNSKFKQAVKPETVQKQPSGKERPQRSSVSSPERSSGKVRLRLSSVSSPERSSGSPQKTVTCKYCNKTLSGRLSRHVENVHAKDRPFKCEVCEDRFVTEPDLKHHCKTRHGRGSENKAFHCEKCGESFISYANLTNHMELKHPTFKFNKNLQEIFRCKVCNKAFAMKNYLRRHELLHMKRGETAPVKTPAAEKPETPEKKSVKTNKKESPDSQSSMGISPDAAAKSAKVASGSLYDCKYCTFQFVTFEDMKRHERTHPGEKPYSCEDCHRSYYKRSHLTLHRAKAHGPKSQTTAVGTKPEIGTKGTVTIKTEPGTSDEQLHKCSKCHKGFTSVTNLRKHYANKHKDKNATSKKDSQSTGGVREKPHACYKCDKKYYTNAHLKEHFERVHKAIFEPPQQTTTSIELKESADALHSCDVCDRSYYDEQHLKDHYATVHGADDLPSEEETAEHNQTREEPERPFHCSDCDKSYTRKGHLNRHYQHAHATKEDAELTEGQQEPPSDEDDETGEDENTGETQESEQYPCPVCDKMYASKGNVKRHYHQVHASSVKEEEEQHEEGNEEPERDLYSCYVCGKSYLTQEHLQDHYSKAHEQEETPMDTPERPKKEQPERPKMEQPERERKYHCDMCEKTYLKKSHLNEHINRVHFGMNREPSLTQGTSQKTQEFQTDIVSHPKGSSLEDGSSKNKEERLKELVKKNKPSSSQPKSADSNLVKTVKSKSDRPKEFLAQSGKRDREGSTEGNIHKKVKLTHSSSGVTGVDDEHAARKIKPSSSSKSNPTMESNFKERSHSPATKIASGHHTNSPVTKIASGSSSPVTNKSSEQHRLSSVSKIKSGHSSSPGQRSNSPSANISPAQHSRPPVNKSSIAKVTSKHRSSSPSLKNYQQGQRSHSPSTNISPAQRSHPPMTKISPAQHSNSSVTKVTSKHRSSSPSMNNSQQRQRSHSPSTYVSSVQGSNSPGNEMSSAKHKKSSLSKVSSEQRSSSPSLKNSQQGQRSHSPATQVSSVQRSHSPSNEMSSAKHKKSSLSKVSSGQRSSSPSLKGSHQGQWSLSPLANVSSAQHSHSPVNKIKISSGQRSHSPSPLTKTSFEHDKPARSSPSSVKISKPSSHSSESKLSSSHSSKDKSSYQSAHKVKNAVSSIAKISPAQRQKEVKQPNQPIYACHVCERTFSVRSNLAAHFQKHHS